MRFLPEHLNAVSIGIFLFADALCLFAGWISLRSRKLLAECAATRNEVNGVLIRAQEHLERAAALEEEAQHWLEAAKRVARE